MPVTMIRTVIIYFFLMAAVRLMGKRQIGQLEPAELVTTILISELASGPITDSNQPLAAAVLPILLLVSVEILLSCRIFQSGWFKRLFCGVPNVLVRYGRIDQTEMRRARVTPEELLVNLRQNGISSPLDAAYVILEENGTLSVVPRTKRHTEAQAADDIEEKEHGIMHVLIVNGAVYQKALDAQRISPDRLSELLLQCGVKHVEEVFLLAMDDAGEVFFAKKEESL